MTQAFAGRCPVCAQPVRFEGTILASEASELAKFSEGVYVRREDLERYLAEKKERLTGEGKRPKRQKMNDAG